MKLNKIIIAMPTEEDFMPSISRWGHDFNWDHCEVHFVHVVRKNFEISESYVIQVPDFKTFEHLKPSYIEFIKKKAHEMMPENVFRYSHFEVFCDQSPADRIADYAKEIDANMIVVATRNKKGIVGLFTSSFADRILQFSPVDVLILRPKQRS